MLAYEGGRATEEKSVQQDDTEVERRDCRCQSEKIKEGMSTGRKRRVIEKRDTRIRHNKTIR